MQQIRLMNAIIILIGTYAIISSVSSITVTLIPIGGYSHTKSAVILGQELVKRGHTVNLLQYGISSTRWNVTWDDINTHDVRLSFDLKVARSTLPLYGMNTFKQIAGGMKFFDTCNMYCIDILNDVNAMKMLENSDLIIGESMMYCVAYIAKYTKKPFIGIHHVALCALNYPLRIPASPAFVPMLSTLETNSMSIQNKIGQYFKQYLFMPIFSVWMDKAFDTIRARTDMSVNIFELLRQVQLYIVPYDPVIEYSQSIPSNMITPGIWTNEPAKRLPNDINEFLSNRSRFILISFGSLFSLIKQENLPPFVSMLAKIEIKVILVGSRNVYGYNLPENVFLTTTSPNDILAHPSIKLFVTHSGIMSVREACYHGVPVLSVPIMSEQAYNGVLLTSRLKMGKMITYHPTNYDEWIKYIPEIINDKRYKVNAMKCSMLMKSKDSREAAKLAIDSVERFISWGYNASHLQPIELSIPWYEYHVLDVVACLIITFGSIYVTARLLWYTCTGATN